MARTCSHFSIFGRNDQNIEKSRKTQTERMSTLKAIKVWDLKSERGYYTIAQTHGSVSGY